MLNFREELSKIKANKLNRVDLQERVEEILKAMQIDVKHSGHIINLRYETFDNRADAVQTSGLIKRYFIEKDFRYFNDVSSKYAFSVLINT